MDKVMVCTPCYDGQVTTQYLHSLLALQNYAQSLLEFRVKTLQGSDLFRMRNCLAEKFYRSDCSHLLWVDADTGFDPSLIGKMLQLDKAFVGALCPRKMDNGGFVCDEFLEYEYIGEFQKISSLGCGLTLVHRKVFKKMRNEYPELLTGSSRYFQSKGLLGDVHQPYAPRLAHDGIILGEDLSFSRRWTDLGGEIWCCTDKSVEHVGTKIYR